MAGVRAAVVGAVVGAAGENAVKEAPEATFRSVCRSDRVVSVVGVKISVPSVSDSTCPVTLSSRRDIGEPLFGVEECRGVAEVAVSTEWRVTVPVPVRLVDAVSLRSLRFALMGGLFTSLVPLGWRGRTGTAASELSSARSSVA